MLFLDAGVGANVNWLFWVSQLHTLLLSLHVPQLGLLWLQEIFPHILGVNEWPRIVVSMPNYYYQVSSGGCPAAGCRYRTVRSMLGSLYTLWMYPSLLVWLNKAQMCFRLCLVVCMVYSQFDSGARLGDPIGGCQCWGSLGSLQVVTTIILLLGIANPLTLPPSNTMIYVVFVS